MILQPSTLDFSALDYPLRALCGVALYFGAGMELAVWLDLPSLTGHCVVLGASVTARVHNTRQLDICALVRC
jgi:hypothetical protein